MCYSTLSHIWTFVTPWPPWRRRSLAEIAARWHYRPPIKNMTSHYNSQFSVSVHCCFLQEAQKRLWTCLNGAETQFSSLQIFIEVFSYKELVYFPTSVCWNKIKSNPISTFPPYYPFHIGEVIQIWLARLMR